jgi:hypothetical protein
MQRGHVRLATRTWKKALRLAQKLQMPFLEGQLHAELARHLRGNEDQKTSHRQKAREFFQAAETGHELKRLEQDPASQNQNAPG